MVKGPGFTPSRCRDTKNHGITIAMKFQLLTFDSAKDPWFLDAKKEFLEKINHLLPLESVVLKSKKISRDTKELKLASERDSFFQYLKPNDALIVFDERAQDLDTMKFKEKFESYFQKSHFQRVLFLVGGAYGVDPQVKQRAQELW